MGKRVIIIGGGIAGIQAAITLKKMGCSPLLIEKSVELGGKLNNWDRLFPSGKAASDIIRQMTSELSSLNIKVMFCSEVSEISHNGNTIDVNLTDGNSYESDALIIATGFDLFNASIKEEYGYGVYKNVITSADLERMFIEGDIPNKKNLESVAFLHCVGSRDMQVGQPHCSKVCCVTAVKQAIEIKQMYPNCNVYSFYMDMRMFGSGYEELYREAQIDYRINFIRGRISEAGENSKGQIYLKSEDTLLAKPLKLTVDMLVLMIGKKAASSNVDIAKSLGIKLNNSSFFVPKDDYIANVATKYDNVFVVGTALAPKSVAETINEATQAAVMVHEYFTLNNKK